MSVRERSKAETLRHYVAMAREACEDAVCPQLVTNRMLRCLERLERPLRRPMHVRAFHDCE